MKKRIAAGGVVFKKDSYGVKILLVKDSYGHWTWPKGHLEDSETPEEGALREIFEETGQKKTEIITKLGEQKYTYDLEGEEVRKEVHIFLVKASDEELRVQKEELAGGGWFTAADALEKIEYEGSKELLEKGIDIILS